MAQINGTTGRNSNYWRYYLVITEQDINIANNTSKLKVDVYVGATSYSRAVRGNLSATHTVNVNGTNYIFTTGAYTIEKNTNLLLGSIVTNAITHNADGTKTVSVTASSPDLAEASGYGPYSGTASGNVTLSTIPRTSSVTCADGNIGSSTTININRSSSDFTHTIKYAFGSLSGTIATKTSNTSIGWTIPTSFYAQIPNAKSGQGTITCETYNGNTLIGTSSCKFNAIVLETANIPTLSATVIDTNATTIALTGDSNKLIKYFSNVKVTISATAKNSATIKSQKVTCQDGKSSTTAVSTLNGVESGVFLLSCTDSRGFSTTASVNKTMINYIKLAITDLTVARVSSTSTQVNATVKGNYFNSSFGSQANTLTLKWRYRVKNGTWSGYTTVTPTKSGNTFSFTGSLGTNYDMDTAYEFEIVATDKLMSITNKNGNTVTVTVGTPLVDMWKDNLRINADIDFPFNVGGIKSNNKYVLVSRAGNIIISPAGGIGILLRPNGFDSSEGQAFLNRQGELIIEDISMWGNQKILKAKELYSNTSGTTGTVTLSETVANFDYIEILYGKSGKYSSVKIEKPNGKIVNLQMFYRANDTTMQHIFADCTINGTSISKTNYGNVNFNTNGTISGGTASDNSIYIYKVIGYR